MKETIYKLLSVIDSETQIKKYLKRFSSGKGLKFAVIKVGGRILEEKMEHLISSLTFLKQVGLTPIVIHGAGPQLSRKLEDTNIKSHFIDGQRVTCAKTLKAAKEVFIAENHALTSHLKEAGVDATSFYSGVFECDIGSKKTLGFVGSIKSVDVDHLLKAVRKGRVPVVSPLGETGTGQIVNVNADSAMFSLAKTIQPYKIIFLTETGGVLDQDNKIIPNISIVNNYNHLIKQPWVHSGMKLKLQKVNDILEALPSATSVSITKPELLAKELFTDKGSGTLVNMGEKVLVINHLGGVDKARLKELIESSFGKKLINNYFDALNFRKAYITECYRAAIVLTGSDDIVYLDKFVVSDSAKGEGLGGSLWDKVTSNHEKLFWRATIGNPINKFYSSVADGFIKVGRWKVYWRGLSSYDEIRVCVDIAKNQDITVIDNASSKELPDEL